MATESRSLALSPLALAPDELSFFRWGRVAGRVLVTNDAGDWAFLSEAEFADLLGGRVGQAHPRFAELQGKGMLRDGLDLDALAARVGQRNRHVRRGAYVHVVTLTRRQHEAAPPAAGLDMSEETAEQVAEFVLSTTSPTVTVELRGDGGEPLCNFAALRRLVEAAQLRNKRSTGKQLTFVALTSCAAMTEERAEWLIANDVRVVTRLDGPASVHDAVRAWAGGAAHADVVRWLELFTRRYAELGRNPEEWHPAALLTVTRDTLSQWRAVVDEYVARGLRGMTWSPLPASRVPPAIWAAAGYEMTAYLDVYRQVLRYVLELNRRGTALREGTAAVLATKVLSRNDAGAVDLQSPYGGGSALLAYDVDGRIFPDDDARWLCAQGDALFALGDVRQTRIGDLAQHPTVRAIAAASLLDAQPMCADCWNKPYCGFSPVRNYLEQEDLFGQRRRCGQCREHLAVAGEVFELVADGGDAAARQVLERWAGGVDAPPAGPRSRPLP
ncbi:MAG: hypothetical protein U0802_15320 [Candidatus Binatia bacterium]